mmetsp:Transcript_2204/g.5456  ORF Transcript_2204/g.5456 Transcript_2204/m.5456 type:complete len:231 (-) Transcript_2204:115-807(-)
MLREREPASNEELIQRLCDQQIIKKDVVARAMLSTDRRGFVLQGASAYSDSPQPLGHKATISAPHMHAHALGLLAGHLKPGARALDIGCGSGYLSVCMARMVGETGRVVAIDYLAPLVEMATANVQAADAELLRSGQLSILKGDGWEGAPNDAPFDAIHVGAAAASVPSALKEQLALGGRMVIPVGTSTQVFWQIDRLSDGGFQETPLMNVRYVPLVQLGEGQGKPCLPR